MSNLIIKNRDICTNFRTRIRNVSESFHENNYIYIEILPEEEIRWISE